MQNKLLEIFKTEKFNKIFNVTILILFIALICLTMFHHELWRDEAQAWLVVRDLNISSLFAHVKTEGHPLLWYAILFPFAKLKLPVFSMQVVSFLLAVSAAVIFIIYSPFNKYIKTAVLFSSGMTYWYSVISRSYSLIPPLLFLCATLYPKRSEKPYVYSFILILLSNTHVLMFGFCTILSILFIFELIKECKQKPKSQIFVPSLLLILNLSSIILYLAAGRYENALVQNFVSQSSTVTNIFQTLISVIQNIYGNIPLYLSALLSMLVVILLTILFKADKKTSGIVLTGIIFQILVYRYVWITSTEKAFLILLILLFGFWITNTPKSTKKISGLLLTTLFIFTWNIAFMAIKNDLLYDYSGSKKAAEFIKKNIPSDAIIISNYNVTTAGISAYLPEQKFYFPNEKSFYTFSQWNKGIMSPYIEYDDFIHVQKTFQDKKLYFIYSYIFNPSELSVIVPQGLVNIYNSPDEVLLKSEKFYIYQR